MRFTKANFAYLMIGFLLVAFTGSMENVSFGQTDREKSKEDSNAFRVPSFPEPTEKELEIEKALERPISFAFQETPLIDVAVFIRDYSGVNVVLDQHALDILGLDPETRITLSLEKVSLKSALKLLLESYGLTYMIQDEVLLLTEWAGELTTRVYPAIDLVLKDFGNEKYGLISEEFMELVHNTIEPENWEVTGGMGTIEFDQASACLVITQTYQIHEELESFFTVLRKARTKKDEILSSAGLPDSKTIYEQEYQRAQESRSFGDVSVRRKEVKRAELKSKLEEAKKQIAEKEFELDVLNRKYDQALQELQRLRAEMEKKKKE